MTFEMHQNVTSLNFKATLSKVAFFFSFETTGQEEEQYCPNLFCADYGCREIPGPAGCPICMCDPICETPVCEPGCEVVTNKHMGKCPVCICSSPSGGCKYFRIRYSFVIISCFVIESLSLISQPMFKNFRNGSIKWN